MNRFHCGRCGGQVAQLTITDSGHVRWFHVMGYTPVYDDPDGMGWRIGHDPDPLPGDPHDRRSAAMPGSEPKHTEAVFVDDDGYIVEPVSYEEHDLNLEGDPAFNGAFDRW
jgi:hypothetical protein